MTIPFAYKGEAMLVRWSETPKGRTVTLLLDPLVGEQHPFKFLKCGENGQRMQIAAALIGDDEKPAVPPTKPAGLAKQVDAADSSAGGRSSIAGSSPAARTYTRSQRAAIMCQDPEFQRFLLARCGEQPPERHADPAASTDHVLKVVLGITSKRELDEDLNKSEAFDRMLASFDYRDRVRA